MAARDLEREKERENSQFMALPVPEAVIVMEHPSPSCPPSSSRTPPNNQFLFSLRRQPHLLLLSRNNNNNHPFVSSKTSRRLLSACLPLIPAFLFFHRPTLPTDVHHIAVAAQIPVLAGKNDEPSSPFDPVSPLERKASARLSQRVSEAISLLDNGREYQAKGDFPQALQCFSQVVRDYKDFAFSEYARVGRALALYELGDRDQAIVEMEDVSISLKGYPEVHAALAAALYVDKHAPLLAENQFTIATLLDPHYTDISYVRENKHWPPSLISSLQRFITFS